MPHARTRATLAAACLVLTASAVAAAPRIGSPAPDFTGRDSAGQPVRLSDLKGKVVVLEWTNDSCPFVGKWYRSGAMQQLQREAATLGVTWLSVVSSAPGEEGYVTGAQADADTKSRKAAPSRVILDPNGTIGHLYDARTTPHMFVVAADGRLAYMGGADSIASTRVEDLPKAEPYLHEALQAVAAGKPVPHAVTRPYGCSVKYAD